MAHVVGVPRRDPCQKCQLPVFLAERLTVGKRVYHRTCLKCARCNSQLTPGSFYETEVDDEYCCETCPDEEEVVASGGAEAAVGMVQMRSSSTENIDPAPLARATTVRSSIADRLAFFEQSKAGGSASGERTSVVGSSKLLQKSVSDEEKSKSLKRMEEATTSSYKMNSALSSFLNDTIDGGKDEPESEASTSVGDSSKTGTQMETSDTEQETEDDLSLEQPTPQLPTTKPPTTVEMREKVAESDTPSKRFTATAQLQLVTDEIAESVPAITPVIADKPKSPETHISAPTPEKRKTVVHMQLSTDNDNANNNEQHENVEANTEQAHKSTAPRSEKEINLELSQINDNDCVTKDKIIEASTADEEPTEIAVASSAESMQSELQALETESSTDVEEQHVELRPKPPTEDLATTERLSVVRARLQQFEDIATHNNDAASPDKDNISTNIKDNDNLSENSHTNASSLKMQTEEEEEDEAEAVKDASKEDAKLEIESESKEPKNMQQEISANETKSKSTEMEMEIVTQTTEPTTESLKEVPLNVESKDNSVIVESKLEEEKVQVEEKKENAEVTTPKLAQERAVITPIAKPRTPLRRVSIEYPEDLNPFKSDDEDEESSATEANKENIRQRGANISSASTKSAEKSNPFDSSDDEVELEKSQNSTASTPSAKVPPPRPPPPRVSRNPFGDETEDETNFSRRSSLTSSLNKKTPVPTPRSNVSQSQNPTPEPTPRLSNKTPQTTPLQNSSDYYGSANSLGATPLHLQRNLDVRGSNNSLTSSAGGTIRSRKSRKAPAPPAPVKELFPSSETIDSSKASTPSSSTVGTPKSGRKKRPAPAPPKPARLDPSLLPAQMHDSNGTAPKNSLSYPLQSESDSKLSDEEKALLEGNNSQQLHSISSSSSSNETSSRRSSRRLIPLDASLLLDDEDDDDDDDGGGKCDDAKQKKQQQRQSSMQQTEEEEANVVYRRALVVPKIDTPTHDGNPLLDELNVAHDRQLEKLKDNKEAKNRNRQSQISAASSGNEDADTAAIYNKSAHGKWKRRKGPAPALPIPPRKVLQMLPLQEIRHELEIIEVQQQGLEKQGVILEKMIRDRCEGAEAPVAVADVGDGQKLAANEHVQNSKEVEDLILQLFELVNEKNELFRRQAELMYLRRQHRLEQEQADLEYEIRVLMAQPERNKTDSDKAREEALIARLVEVVQLRNEVIECLEMDRLREAEEDLSIKQRLELHTAQRDCGDGASIKTLTKLSKKEKKKQKEAKKLSKSKKIDADKDADDTELSGGDKQKLKKKKKKFLF